MKRYPATALVLLLLTSCSHHEPSGPQQISSYFHPVIQNVGPTLAPHVQTAFDTALAVWERMITGGLPIVSNFSDNANDCGAGFPAVSNQTITDVLIQIRVDSIDGPGKILGRSGPCFLRNSPDNRTVLGTMTLDSADLNHLDSLGRLADVITHEMGHVFGFGTLWGPKYFSCLNDSALVGTTPEPDTYYGCARARAVFDSIGGTTYTGGNKVPVENCNGISGCGAGTWNSHWRESVFFNELMTGYLQGGTANPLSVLTLAAMQDMGYTVDFSAAQPYVRVFTSTRPALTASPSMIMLGDDIERRPLRFVNRRGQVVGIVPQ